MKPEMMEKLKKSLTLHESRRNFPYVDTVGKTTIGIGYNLTDRGLPDSWIDDQFLKDANYFHDTLSKYDWFNRLNDDRKIVLIDMAFMGLKPFLSFKKMISCLENDYYDGAADQMLDSKWASQVKGRAQELAQGMKIGVYSVKS